MTKSMDPDCRKLFDHFYEGAQEWLWTDVEVLYTIVADSPGTRQGHARRKFTEKTNGVWDPARWSRAMKAAEQIHAVKEEVGKDGMSIVYRYYPSAPA